MHVRFPCRLLVVLLAVGACSRAASLSEAIALTPHPGHAAEDSEIQRWQKKAGGSATNEDAFLGLAWAYIAKARRSSDTGYYKLAEETAKAGEARFGSSAELRLVRGHVLHNLHRFREAHAIAAALTSERGEPGDLALLADVLVDEGSVDEAVTVLQRLVNLKPGAEAYSRIAHVRWLKGDLTGAITSMELAVTSSSPAQAAVHAWFVCELSRYRLQAGALDQALSTALAANRLAPDYAPALLALGKVRLALNDPAGGVASLERAAAINPLPEYQWWLSDALRSAGRPDDAGKIVAQLTAGGPASDPRTTAVYLATAGVSLADALKLASDERTQRQDVFTADAYAWALSANGRNPEALEAMQHALTLRTKDARLLLHAAMICARNGDGVNARNYFAAAAPYQATLTPSERALLAAHAFKPSPDHVATAP